jgi:hypothetical protein
MPKPRFEHPEPAALPGEPFSLDLVDRLAVRAVAVRDGEIATQSASLAKERELLIAALRQRYGLPKDANIQVTDLNLGTAVWTAAEKKEASAK